LLFLFVEKERFVSLTILIIQTRIYPKLSKEGNQKLQISKISTIILNPMCKKGGIYIAFYF